jgi:lipid II:glycine glycyltransferase (peptidoglycan interpeptide bridge formation enzyme)
MRGQADRDDESREGQGEVIAECRQERPQVSVRPVPLSFLDASDEMLQSGFWGHFKQAHGWQALAFDVTAVGESGGSFGVLALSRRLLRLFSLAYIPFGPVFDPIEGRGELLSALARALRSHLPRATLFLRFDLPWRKTGEKPFASARPRVVKAASDIQPPHTVVVDIAPPLDQVLSSMKPKTRYNVRLSSKKGVTVREGGPDDLDRW